jgi:hypothetical protein
MKSSIVGIGKIVELKCSDLHQGGKKNLGCHWVRQIDQEDVQDYHELLDRTKYLR